MLQNIARFIPLPFLVILAVITAAIIFVASYPRVLVERYLVHALERGVTLGELNVSWGSPLTVEARDLVIDNASWGTASNFLHVARAVAVVDVSQIWRGATRLQKLDLEGPVLTLERGAGEQRNWRFGAARPAGSGDRAGFPVLREATVRNGAIVLRRQDRKDIRIDFTRGAVATDGDDAPIEVVVHGAYNGAPLDLTGTGGSFLRLRDAVRPYPTRFTVAARNGRIAFDGAMDRPLDFDGVHGPVQIAAADLGAFLADFGVGAALPFRLDVGGALTKQGDSWRVDSARGELAGNPWRGAIGFVEGGRDQPDSLDLRMDFERLVVDSLLTSAGAGPLDLAIDRTPGVLIAAQITAPTVSYRTYKAENVALRGRIGAGRVTVERLQLGLLGGAMIAAANAVDDGAATRIHADATLSGFDAAQVVGLLGDESNELVGQLYGRAIVDTRGRTEPEARANASGHAVLGMGEGSVARALTERASLNLRSVFRRAEQWDPLICLMAAAEMRDGVVTVSPARLRTNEAWLAAHGQVDLNAGTVDAVLGAEATTSVLALRVPVRIRGPFDNVDASPAPQATTDAPPVDLPPELQAVARENACSAPAR